MTFQGFSEHVAKLADAHGIRPVRIYHDDFKRYVAVFADGTKIIGRETGLSMTVRFGSGHQAMFAVR